MILFGQKGFLADNFGRMGGNLLDIQSKMKYGWTGLIVHIIIYFGGFFRKLNKMFIIPKNVEKGLKTVSEVKHVV